MLILLLLFTVAHVVVVEDETAVVDFDFANLVVVDAAVDMLL